MRACSCHTTTSARTVDRLCIVHGVEAEKKRIHEREDYLAALNSIAESNYGAAYTMVVTARRVIEKWAS